MKIHSKFRDYYDSAMAFGVDDHVNWVRNVHEESIDKHLFLDKAMYTESPRMAVRYRGRGTGSKNFPETAPNHVTIFVGFCGKIYPGIRFSWESPKFDEGTIYRTVYDTDGIIKVLTEFDEIFKTNRVELFVSKKKAKGLGYKPWKGFSSRIPLKVDTVQKYFDKYSGRDYLEPFVELQVPIFVMQPDTDGFILNVETGKRCQTPTMYINPPLTEYEFQKVFDPYTAYQEIEMFLGGVLTELDEIDVPGVGDKDLAVGKGFNEWSFKTLPTKHRKRGK